jgi:hypothetical protein
VVYKLENRDTRPHNIGIRFMLDTFIGDNDGVPFLIPGRKELCNTSAEFNNASDIPDFIQARESDNLSSPGTICQLGLKLGDLEPPSRVTLGSWPNPQLNTIFRDIKQPYRQEKTLWDVPVQSMQVLKERGDKADSCVVIYWADKPLGAGQSRSMGFTYGLGTVAGGEGGGQLAVTVGGSFYPGGEFTVTAYVQDPRPGQTVKLTLPDSFTLVEGAETQNVPPIPAGAASKTSPVSWKVRASKLGTFPVKVTSSTGKSQTQQVRIREKGIFGN